MKDTTQIEPQATWPEHCAETPSQSEPRNNYMTMPDMGTDKSRADSRNDLRSQLKQLYPTLAYLYDSCLQLLDHYNEENPDARATIALLAHGVREMLNSIPDILGTGITSNRSIEERALRSLRAELSRNDSIVMPDETTSTISISRTLAETLLHYRKSRELGAATASDRMAAVFLGDPNVRGGSLAAVKNAEDFFMKLVHIDRAGTSSLPRHDEVLSEFALIEASVWSRLGDFFEAKHRIQHFLTAANHVDTKGLYRAPSHDEVRRGLALAADQFLAHVFFGTLENPRWLRKLIELRALTDLSTPDTTGDWRERAYIVRMASVVPDEVCTALSTATPQSPRIVKSAVLECAAQMPARNAAQLISSMLSWTGENADLEDYLWQKEHLTHLFSSVLQNDNTRRMGKKLLQQLFCPRPDPSHDHNQPYYGRFYACVPLGIYEESLSAALGYLTSAAQIGIVRAFFSKLEAACFPHGTPHTSLTIPSIDEALIGRDEALDNQLVRVAYPILEGALNHNQKQFEKALTDEQHHSLQRCAMGALTHVLEECSPDEARAILPLADKAFSISTILEGDYDPELFPLIRAVMKQDMQHPLDPLFSRFEIVATEHFNRWRQLATDQGQTDAALAETEAAKHMRHWKHRVLTLVGPQNLKDDLRSQYTLLEEEFGSISYEERHVSVMTNWGPTSPISLAQMQRMAAGELFSYLVTSHFSKQDIFDLKSHRGQGDVLRQLFAEAPCTFAACSAQQIMMLRPTYITAILRGWSEAVNKGLCDNIDQLVGVCELLSSVSDGTTFPAEGDKMDDDANYDEARRAASDLLYNLLAHQRKEKLYAFHSKVLDALLAFSTSSLHDYPTIEDLEKHNTSPVNGSINETGSIALKALGLWLYAFSENTRSPEALAALGVHLPNTSDNPCDAAAFGFIMPHLLVAAHDWLDNHYSDLLGASSPNTCQQIVLTTTLRMCCYSQAVFDYLSPAMKTALLDGCEMYVLGYPSVNSDCNELIGEWVLHALLLAHISYQNEIFELWEHKADSNQACMALLYHSRGIANAETTRVVLVIRAALLWDRFLAMHASAATARYLFDSLRSLLGMHLLDESWWASRLQQVYALNPKTQDLALLDNELESLSMSNPEAALSILSIASTQLDMEHTALYSLKRVAVPMLYHLLSNQDAAIQCKARNIMSNLGRSGITDLDTLVEEYGHQYYGH